jgi:hypothetical protein
MLKGSSEFVEILFYIGHVAWPAGCDGRVNIKMKLERDYFLGCMTNQFISKPCPVVGFGIGGNRL